MADKVIQYGGTTHSFPDSFSDGDISDALSQWDKQNPVQSGDISLDQGSLSAQAKLAPTLDRLKRNINTRAGGMGYGEDVVPKAKDTGILNAITRTAKGVAEMPGQLLGPPSTPTEAAIDTAGPIGRGALALKRAVYDPAQQEFEQAHQYRLKAEAVGPDTYQGKKAREMQLAHNTAGVVPLVGPIAGNLTERAMGGDPAGAVTEALAIREGIPRAAEGLRRVTGKVAYPMADEMRTAPTGTGEINPTQAFSGSDIKAHAEKIGVDLTPAEITESGGLRAIQGIGQKSLWGKSILQKQQSRAQSGLIKDTQSEMRKVGPDTANSTQVGRDLYRQASDAAVKAKEQGNTDYATWRQSLPPGPIDIDLTPLKEKYGNLLDTNKDVFDNIPSEQAGRLKGMLGKAKDFGLKSVDEEGNVDINPRMDLESVREMRSHWLDTQRELKRHGRADSREAATATDIAADLDKATENGLREHGEFHADGTPEQKTAAGQALVDGWRKANTSWKKYIDDFHGDDSVLADILDTGNTDMVKLPGRVLEKATGGNPVHIGQLREHGIKLGGLQREVMDRALNQGFRTSQNRLAGFDDDFLQHVFADNPEALNHLYKNARIGKSVGLDFNPSNTAGALNARTEFEAPIRAAVEAATSGARGALEATLDAVPGYGAAKLSTSKLFKNWMTRVPSSPLGKWLTKRGGKGGNTTPPAGGAVPPAGSGDSTPGSGGTGEVTPQAPAAPTTPETAAGPEPLWPKEYKGSAQTLSRDTGAGANYTPDALAKLKKAHDIIDEPAFNTDFHFGQNERRGAGRDPANDVRIAPLREAVRKAKTNEELVDAQQALDYELAAIRGVEPPRLTPQDLTAEQPRGTIGGAAAGSAPKLKMREDYLEDQDIKEDLDKTLTKNGSTGSVADVLQPEGGRQSGTGPGAMLRKNSKLIEPMKSGPQTGDTARPVMNKLLKKSNAQKYFGGELTGEHNVNDLLLDPQYQGMRRLTPKELRALTPQQTYINPTIVNRYIDSEERPGGWQDYDETGNDRELSSDEQRRAVSDGMQEMQPGYPPLIAETSDGAKVIVNGTHRTIAGIKTGRGTKAQIYNEGGYEDEPKPVDSHLVSGSLGSARKLLKKLMEGAK